MTSGTGLLRLPGCHAEAVDGGRQSEGHGDNICQSEDLTLSQTKSCNRNVSLSHLTLTLDDESSGIRYVQRSNPLGRQQTFELI